MDRGSDLGFVMPPEWAPHRSTLMAWPARSEVWEERLEEVEAAYADVAHAIALFEHVIMVVDPRHEARARHLLRDHIEIMVIPINDSWIRDSGPVFLKSGHRLMGLDLGFNAWGRKYASFMDDAELAGRLCQKMGLPRRRAPFIAEGGAFSIDGRGTVLTTHQCLLTDTRNFNHTEASLDPLVREAFGARKVIWLPGDPDDVETDGHVDLIAAFAGDGVVLVNGDARGDARRQAIMDANIAVLKAARDASGASLRLLILPEAPRSLARSDLFAGSYVNAYVCNKAVIVPKFGAETDEEALKVYAKAFPDREVVGVMVEPIAQGGGSIHCITQQIPA